jgi:hypothetical protein
MLKNPEKFGDSHDPFLESMGQVLQPEPTCAHSWVPASAEPTPDHPIQEYDSMIL